jgi:hypothetical protein
LVALGEADESIGELWWVQDLEIDVEEPYHRGQADEGCRSRPR